MKLSVGQKLFSAVDGTAVVVIRTPDTEVSVTCGGHEMSADAAAQDTAAATVSGDGAVIGKRYTADGVDIELLCVKGGSAPLAVNGAAVAQKTAKPLPASD